jgi:hypothetical protein
MTTWSPDEPAREKGYRQLYLRTKRRFEELEGVVGYLLDNIEGLQRRLSQLEPRSVVTDHLPARVQFLLKIAYDARRQRKLELGRARRKASAARRWAGYYKPPIEFHENRFAPDHWDCRLDKSPLAKLAFFLGC